MKGQRQATSKLARPSAAASSRLSPTPLSRDLTAIERSARAVGLTPAAAEQYAAQLLLKMPPATEAPALLSTDDLRIGDRVMVGGTKHGIIAFIGEVHFGPGEWAGIVLDAPTGKNDGSVGGRRYFMCEPKRGIFSRLDKLTRISGFMPVITPSGSSDRGPSGSGSSRSSSKSAGAPDSRVSVSPLERAATPKTTGDGPRQSQSVQNTLSPRPGDVPADTSMELGGLCIGDRVIVSGHKPGTLRFLGPTDFSAGIWAGVELDEPSGKNDGCVAGTRYFQCEPMYGLFTPVHKLSYVYDGERPSPVPSSSSDTSRQSATPRPDGSSSSQPHERSLVSEPGNLRMENGNTARDGDEISRRLKLYIEKLEADKIQLSNQLHDEKKKTEDLQFALEEAGIEKSDLEAQVAKEVQLRHAMEEKLSKETNLTERLSKDLASSKSNVSSNVISDETIDEYLDQIEELTHKLSVAENRLKAAGSGLCEKCQKPANSGTSKKEQEALTAELATVTSELEKAKHDRRELESHMLSMLQDLKKAEVERDMAEKRKADISSRLDTVVAERDGVVAEKSKLQAKLKERENMFKELGDKAQQMEKLHLSQTGELRKHIENMQTEMEKLMEAQKQLLPYKQQVDQLSHTVETLTKEREMLRANLNELQATVLNHQQLESQNAANQAQMQEMKARFLQMTKDVEAEKAKLLDIVESTKKAIQSKDTEVQQLRAEMSRMKEQQVQAKSTSSDLESQLLQQRIVELEKALAETTKNASIGADNEDSVRRLQKEKEAAESQVGFLNAVIVEIQRKNNELERSLKQSLTCVNGPVNGHPAGATGLTRIYCDICDVYDQHDTEDCPQQEMSAPDGSEERTF